MSGPDNQLELNRIDSLYKKASDYIDQARQRIQRSVDSEIVKAYWFIGRDIVEEEQLGLERANYGGSVLKQLSVRLTQKYNKGFSVDTLERARKFYLTYSNIDNQKSAAVLRISDKSNELQGDLPIFSPNLAWGHYIVLMRIKNSEARAFYEVETINNHWTSRELQRQIGSMLFERLLKSKNKKEILKLARKGQELNVPSDAIKDPIILEFLGLPEAHQLEESKLEEEKWVKKFGPKF